MQTNQTSIGRSAIKLFALLMFSSFIFLAACKDRHDGDGSPGSKEFKMNCVILTYAQVQAWVDSGWTKPDNPDRIRELSLQFYSANLSSLNSNMQLVCYPGKTATDVHASGKTVLAIDTVCVSKPRSGETIFGNNIAYLEALKIINPDGTLNKFDYIRFTPAQAYPPYINFSVEIVRDGIPQAGDGTGTWPCPTYCL
jgi:hypothetical protein